MHARLLELYNQELAHVREMGAEFARQFPKVAARLTLDGVEVADPYVERLLEGFAFLAARVQLKIEAEFPRFVQHLAQVAYPGLIAPVPSMAIARLRPDSAEPALLEGVEVARGSLMRSLAKRGGDTTCLFRTAHGVTLWPLEIAAVQYFSFLPDLPLARMPAAARAARGGLRIRLRAFDGMKIAASALERLVFHISAPDETAIRLYELIFASATGVAILPAARPPAWFEWRDAEALQPVGFEEEEALLPSAGSTFGGYRLLQEYAALPQRFLFFSIDGLGPAIRRVEDQEFEIVVFFDRGDATLEALVDRASLCLYCTPIVNLFPKRLDRMPIDNDRFEFQVVADRSRPLDFEVHEIQSVTAFAGGGAGEQRFLPLYASLHPESADHAAYFTTRREARPFSARQSLQGNRSSYRGSEVYLSLVDQNEAPHRGDLHQVAVQALCSNRDLPLLLPAGGREPEDRSDFQLEVPVPLQRIQCLRGPTRPHLGRDEGAVTWQLVSQLALNYLSLLDTEGGQGAAVLRALLRLYGDIGDAALRRQIDGLRAVSARQTVRRLPMPGPLAFGTGIEVVLRVDETAFQGASAFLLGAVLERFVARQAAINSFTEFVVRSEQRGEIKRFAPRAGRRPLV